MEQNKIILKKDGLSAVFLKNGDLYQLCKNEIMINQLNGNNLDGSVNQIYLRILEKGQIFAVPLTGSNSKSEFWYDQNQLSWSGSYAGVIYQEKSEPKSPVNQDVCMILQLPIISL